MIRTALDRALLCESLLQDLMNSTAMMARVNRDDMLSAQPRPHPAWLCPCGIAGQALHGVEGLRTN
eukprot:scaffold3414_cov113-Isochrysis_galbana.AAC.3